MGHTVVDSLPAAFYSMLDNAILQCETDPNVIQAIKKAFLNDVEKGNGYQHIWNVYGFTLTKHNAPYSHIQLYRRRYMPVNDKNPRFDQGFVKDDADISILILKTSSAKSQIHCFLGNASIELVKIFRENKTDYKQVSTRSSLIGAAFLMNNEGSTSAWDNLKIYESRGIGKFYEKQNYLTSCYIAKTIFERQNEKKLTIINLGCGTDQIFNYLDEQLKPHPPNIVKNIKYIGMDSNKPSIETKKLSMANKKTNIPAQWICRDALEAAQDQSFFTELDGDVYVIASGLLNFQVLVFDEALKVMQSLRNQPTVKKVYITGLTQTFISSYIGKQIGFESSLLNSYSASDQNVKAIELFAPMEHEAWKRRFISKSEKSKILDLSFVKNTSSIINAVTEEQIKGIEHVLLCCTDFNQSDMSKFQQWKSWNPKILFIAESMNQEQHESILLKIRTSPVRWHFMYRRMEHVNPIKSPSFFKLFEDISAYDSPLGNGYENILRNRLWAALNEDRSTGDDAIIAKNDLHSMISGMSFYFEKNSSDENDRVTTDDFLKYLIKSGISFHLYREAENYIRMVPITLFSDHQYYDESYQRYRTVGDQSLKAYHIASKLHGEGVIKDNEWSLLKSRYEEAGNADKNKVLNPKK